MQIAKLFLNGRSQAVRLPKDCRFDGEEVYIKKYDDIVILIPKKSPWSSMLTSLSKFSDDFMNRRDDTPPQERQNNF
ncbi:MAG: type II toxin-antitoxin system VapB family antitoxin [Leptospirales bacterium]